MNVLKKKSLKRAAGPITLWLTLAIAMFIVLLPMCVRTYQNIEDIDFSSDLSNVYVNEFVPDLYGEYCEVTEDGELSEVYYVMLTPDNHYIGIRFTNDNMDRASNWYNMLCQYDEGKITEEELMKHKFLIQGDITEMSEDLPYLKDFVGWEKMTQEQQESFVFSYVTAETKKDRNIAFGAIIALIVLMLLIDLIIVLRCLLGWNQKSINTYIKEHQGSVVMKERINAFFATSEVVPGFWMNEQYFCGLINSKVIFCDTKDIVWAYENQIEHRTYGIKTGTEFFLMVGMKDGKIHQINVGKQMQTQQVLQVMQAKYPWIVIGYSDELEKLFRKNFSEFLDIAYNENMQTEGTLDENSYNL